MMSNDYGVAVKQAIDALSNPQSTKSANDWLMQFERSPDAWPISERMLHDPNQTYAFFGAKFLYSKIQKQALLLSEEDKMNLQRTLSDHIVRIASYQRCDSQLVRYLCLCLSALALQVNDCQVVQSTLQRLNPLVGVHSMTLVTFLSVLPEEAFNGQIDVSSTTRDSFLVQLSGSSNDVLNFLTSLWESTNSQQEMCKMIKCFTNWMDITTIPFTTITQHKIYLDCIGGINSSTDDLLDSSVDLITVLIRRYQSHHMHDIVQAIVPSVISLQHRWEHLETRYVHLHSDEIDEAFALEAFALSKLFTEVSESCIEIFLDLGSDYGQRALLYLLVHCCNYPFDHNVSRIPHKFFYDLSLLLKSNDERRNALLVYYNNVYSELLLVAVNRLVISVEDRENSSDERNDWREVVLDCQDVLSADSCFQILCSQLQAALHTENVQWLKIEANLFAIGVVVPKISDQTAKPIVPELIRLCCSVPKEYLQLQITCISLLGGLSHWIKDASAEVSSQFFETLLRYVTEEKLSTPASVAVLATCRNCGPSININLLVDNLERVTAGGICPREVELNLIEAVCCVVNAFGTSQQNEWCGRLVMSLDSSLSLAVSSSNIKLIGQCLDKISILSKTILSTSLLTSIFNHMWPNFQQVLGHISKEALAEKVCKSLKYFIRGCKIEIVWALPTMSEIFAKGFAVHGYSAYLYCSGICISTFGGMEQGKYHPTLYSLVWSLSSSFFVRFSDIASFERDPEIVEEYFYMVSKLLQYCPRQFLSSHQESTSILNAAVVGLQIHHRQAQKGMLYCLERFCQLPRYYEDNLDALQSCRSLIASLSPKIMHSVVNLLSGKATAFSIDEANGCVCDLLWELRKQSGHQNFEVCLKDF